MIEPDQIAEVRIKPFQADGVPKWRSFLLEHPDGVYVDLPELDYLNDGTALSYSAFKTLNSSPPDWWWESPLNTLEDKVRKSTPALRFGSAIHCGLLEPEGELEKRFAAPPSPDDPRYKDYARTVPEIKAKITALGNKPSGTRKADLIDQLLDLDPKAKIFDILMDGWKREGKTALTEEQMAKLKLMIRMAEAHPHLKNAFTGIGLSEVSVFWTDASDPDMPIRQRARFDRLKPKATIDLKSFSNWQGRDFRRALLREAALREYPMQSAHYDIGRQEARRLVAEGKIYFCAEVLMTDAEIEAANAVRENEDDWLEVGAKKTVFRSPTDAEMELVNAIFGEEEWVWIWVFYKTDASPTAQPVRLDRDTMPMRIGHENRTRALASFRHYAQMFGVEPGKMWMRLDPMWTPEDVEWPAFMDPNVS